MLIIAYNLFIALRDRRTFKSLINYCRFAVALKKSTLRKFIRLLLLTIRLPRFQFFKICKLFFFHHFFKICKVIKIFLSVVIKFSCSCLNNTGNGINIFIDLLLLLLLIIKTCIVLKSSKIFIVIVKVTFVIIVILI